MGNAASSNLEAAVGFGTARLQVTLLRYPRRHESIVTWQLSERPMKSAGKPGGHHRLPWTGQLTDGA